MSNTSPEFPHESAGSPESLTGYTFVDVAEAILEHPLCLDYIGTEEARRAYRWEGPEGRDIELTRFAPLEGTSYLMYGLRIHEPFSSIIATAYVWDRDKPGPWPTDAEWTRIPSPGVDSGQHERTMIQHMATAKIKPKKSSRTDTALPTQETQTPTQDTLTPSPEPDVTLTADERRMFNILACHVVLSGDGYKDLRLGYRKTYLLEYQRQMLQRAVTKMASEEPSIPSDNVREQFADEAHRKRSFKSMLRYKDRA